MKLILTWVADNMTEGEYIITLTDCSGAGSQPGTEIPCVLFSGSLSEFRAVPTIGEPGTG